MLSICSSQKSSTRQAFSSSETVPGDNIRPMLWLLVKDWKRVFGLIFYFRFWQYMLLRMDIEYSGRFYRYEACWCYTVLSKKCHTTIHLDHSKLRSQHPRLRITSGFGFWCWMIVLEVTSATVCWRQGWTPPSVSHWNFVKVASVASEQHCWERYFYELWITNIHENYWSFCWFWWYKVKSIHNFFISSSFRKTSEVNLVD